MVLEILEEQFIPIAKVKELLKDSEEKTYEQKLAFEHAKKFSKIKIEKARELFKELKGLDLRRLKDKEIVKIIDILPKNIDELKSLFAGSSIPLKKEEVEKIFEIVKKYVK